MSVSKHLCTLKPLDSNQVHKMNCYLEITIHFGLKNVKILCDDITVMVTQNLVYIQTDTKVQLIDIIN